MNLSRDRSTQPTILLVEDSSDNRRLVEAVLRINGFQVVSTGMGAATLELARLHSPDVILMDLQLPILDGFEVTKKLKRDEALKHIPVIAITAHTARANTQKALDVGCVEVLKKPFKISELVELVQRVLPDPSPAKGPSAGQPGPTPCGPGLSG